jgi:hypothetical protein
MISGSARNTTAAESRFRIQAPNATARRILVVALDPVSQRLTRQLQRESWRGLDFVDVSGWRAALEAHVTDVLIIISGAHQPVEAVQDIGDHVMESAAGIAVSAVLLRGGADFERVSQSLRQLRPWTRTITVLDDADDFRDVLHALGA